MPLTPKEQGGGLNAPVFPTELAYAALIEASYSSTGAVATDCTIALGWKPTNASATPLNDATGHYLLTVQKQGSTVRVWKQGTELPTYGGAVGSTYAAFVQNVLTYYAGSYHGIYSRLVVVEQVMTYSDFWSPSGVVTGLWVPKELSVPTFNQVDTATMFSGGTASGNYSDYGMNAVNVFSGSNTYDATHTWNSGSTYVGGGYAIYDHGVGNERAVWEYRLQADNSYGGAYTPATISVQGSNDSTDGLDGNWTTIDTFNPSAWSVNEWTTRTPEDTTAYRWIRLYASGHQGGNEFMIGRFVAYDASEETYGAGGGLLDFANGAGLGDDTSGNGNDWTITGTQLVDTPTDNFATLNPLANFQGATLSGGNLTVTTDGSNKGVVSSTIPLPADALIEIEVDYDSFSSADHATIGICADVNRSGGEDLGARADDYAYYSATGQLYNNNILSAYGASYTSGDTINVLWDGPNGTLEFLKNGVSQGQAVTGLTGDYFFALGDAQNAAVATMTVNFGAGGSFAHSQTGYNLLTSSNLPDPTILKSSEVSDVVLREGTGASATLSLPDMTDIDQYGFLLQKNRDAAKHWPLTDAERGDLETLYTSVAGVSQTESGGASLLSSGYTVGSDATFNASGDSFVDLALLMKPEYGGQIVTTTGDDTYKAIPHDLGKKPTLILGKVVGPTLPAIYTSWYMWHEGLPDRHILRINSTGAMQDDNGVWGTQQNAMSATHFGVGQYMNQAGYNYVFYVFTDSDVFKAFSYDGNGSADGPFVNLGGKVLALPFWKAAEPTSSWSFHDSARDLYNPVQHALYPSGDYAEAVTTQVDFKATGFKVTTGGISHNDPGGLIVGLAILESTKYSNAF